MLIHLDARPFAGTLQEPHSRMQMRAGNRFRLGAAITSKFGPDAGEGEKRPIIIERKPPGIGGRLPTLLSSAL
jgi:hypothetical protein